MPVILKIKCQNDLHRVLLQDENLSFESVVESIKGLYPAGNIAIKYLDAEEDLCTLCPPSFSDFLSHATELNGKKTLKVELFERPATFHGSTAAGIETKEAQADSSYDQEQTENPLAQLLRMGLQTPGSAAMGNVPTVSKDGGTTGVWDQEHIANPFGVLLRTGMQFMKGFGKGGFGGFGKGGCGKGGYGFHRGHGYDHKPKIKMLMVGLVQLYKNGLLDADSFSALLLSSLPQLMTLAAEHPEKVNWKLDKVGDMDAFLENLFVLVASTDGLHQCQTVISNWQDKQITADQALLQLLPELMALPFEAQVVFAKRLYASQEEAMRAKCQTHRENHPWIPTVPMIHEGVTCDACSTSPIVGVRFKCTTCPDYDLCATCFTKKSCSGTGSCAEHDFNAMIFPDCMAPWGKGKGKCKGNGKPWWACDLDVLQNLCKAKGKGMFKGKGKGKAQAWRTCNHDEQQNSRPCAREGCEFASTWHATHCCGACERGGAHGKCCKKQVFEPPIAAEILTATEDMEQSVGQQGILPYDLPTVETAQATAIAGKSETCTSEHTAAGEAGLPQHDEGETLESKDVEAFVPKVEVSADSIETFSSTPAAEDEATPPKPDEDEVKSTDMEGYEFVEVAKESAANSDEQHQNGDHDLMKTAMHLAEAGLGDVDVLMALLKTHNGSVQEVLEELVNQP